jgi:uncharacterized RDD family membrane protein YckC
MQLTCAHCSRSLEITGDAPSFCPYCGKSLSSAKQVSTIAFDYEGATHPPGDTPPLKESPSPVNIGGYRLVRQIGRGGMGTVHEGEEIATGRRVAVKLIARQFGGCVETVERFRQEGRLASLITHPRCVFVLAADEEEGQPYIVMELMPGATLQELVERRGPLPVEQAVARILDVIEGLEEAHRLGVIHRDVKPSNCFIEQDGRIKIGDFGLSKSLAPGAHLTRTGAFLGTPLYASPEQIRADRVDEQSDVYSVAATLYFLLTGRAPHETGDATATLARIVSEPAASMRSFRAQIPANLDEIVLRGLERLRDERWRNLADFREALLPFVPGRVTPAGFGVRFGAFLVDAIGLRILGAVVSVVLGALALPISTRVWSLMGLELVLAVLYFGTLEGRWGATLGKRLLGLRVRTALSGAAPGLPRAMLRIAVCYSLLNWGYVVSLALMQPYLTSFQGPKAREIVASHPIALMLAGIFPWLTYLAGVGLLFSTARKRNGLRGLHEFASGTRVVALPWWHDRKLLVGRASELPLMQPMGLPAEIGSYLIRGALRWDDDSGERLLLAEDTGLSRKVWIWLRPPGAAPLSKVREETDRLSRLRCLAGGSIGDSNWHAFVAPTGCSLTDLIATQGRQTWPTVRPLLEEVADELAQAAKDGTLPEQLSAAQVWLEPNGRVKLLDLPLKSDARALETGNPDKRALHLLSDVAALTLEGKPREHARGTNQIRAPYPLHASKILRKLLPGARSYVRISEFQEAMRETRERQPEVTRARRMTTLLGLAASVAIGLLFMLFFVWGYEFGMLLYRTQLVNEGRLALEHLREGTSAELTAANAQPDPIQRADALIRLQENDRLEARLTALVEHDRLLVAASRNWLNPILPMTQAIHGQIGGETDEEAEKHRKNYRAHAEEMIAEIEGEDPRVMAARRWESTLYWGILAIWPVVWVLWVLITRGGMVLWLTGLSLVNSRGQRASRLRCAWRTFLIWLPVYLLLAASLQWQTSYWGSWRPGQVTTWQPLVFWILPWLALALVLSYGVLALWFPARGLHDRLAGTYLVPR